VKYITARNVSSPRRSSLGYRRSRASSHKPNIRGWPKYNDAPKILAFPGFKAGMSRVIYKEDSPKSHLANTDREAAVTVIETPPVALIGLRTYKITPYGLKILAETRITSPSKHMRKTQPLPDEFDLDKGLKTMEETLDKAVQIRALIHTQPELTFIGTKKPSIFEIKIGSGDIKEGFEWAKERIGQELNIEDFTKPGDYVDVIGITKGKGFQGPVKRHGVTLLQKKSKHTKRGVGSIAPWTPARVQWVIARYGQLGYFRRTEYNKRVMMLGSNPEDVNPKGDFVKYGSVKNRYCVVHGSVPGPKKRMVLLRQGLRNQDKLQVEPQIMLYSKLSQQGNAGRQEA
jgi:large subunit ribosomal protein L3